MELSVSAIVILVMAMAVLGIGLGLIRGVLGSGKDKLLDSIDQVDLTEEATSDRRITNYNNIKLRSGGRDNQLIIGYYNAAVCNEASYMWLDCNGAEITNDPISVDIPVGTAGRLGSILTTDAEAKSYGCTISVYCGTPPAAGGTPTGINVSQATFVQVTT